MSADDGGEALFNHAASVLMSTSEPMYVHFAGTELSVW